MRFGLDFLRATDVEVADPRLIAGLTPGHFGAVLLLVAGLGVAARIFRGPPVRVHPEAQWPPGEPVSPPGASSPGDEGKREA